MSGSWTSEGVFGSNVGDPSRREQRHRGGGRTATRVFAASQRRDCVSVRLRFALFHSIRAKGPRLAPGESYPDEVVTRKVMNLLTETEQREQERDVLLREQKLVVRMVPIRVLHCQVGEKEFFADVFDNDRKVFCPDYPVQKCALFNNLKHSCCIL